MVVILPYGITIYLESGVVKMNKNERHKQNRQMARQKQDNRPAKMDKVTRAAFILWLGGLLWDYHSLYVHWDNLHFVMDVIFTILWFATLAWRVHRSRTA